LENTLFIYAQKREQKSHPNAHKKVFQAYMRDAVKLMVNILCRRCFYNTNLVTKYRVQDILSNKLIVRRQFNRICDGRFMQVSGLLC